MKAYDTFKKLNKISREENVALSSMAILSDVEYYLVEEFDRKLTVEEFEKLYNILLRDDYVGDYDDTVILFLDILGV